MLVYTNPNHSFDPCIRVKKFRNAKEAMSLAVDKLHTHQLIDVRTVQYGSDPRDTRTIVRYTIRKVEGD